MNIDLKNWDLVRIIRLLFGIMGWVAFIMSHDPIYALIGSLLLIQAVFNMSCGIGGCGYPAYKKTKIPSDQPITFEEIK
jgi:hypothetical protein